MGMKREKLDKFLLNELMRSGGSLLKIPKNFYADMMKKTGETYSVLTTEIWKMRKEKKCRPQADKSRRPVKRTKLYNECVKIGAIRTHPVQNLLVTEKVAFELARIWTLHPDAMSYIPKARRIGLIYGTATPFAVSPDHAKFCNSVFVDELFVQFLLSMICSELTIKTGTGVSKNKACGKNKFWDEVAKRKNVEITKGLVSSETLFEDVDKVCTSNPRKEIMLFLSHSGTRHGSSRKYSFPTDFEGTCRRLTEKHTNLRIFAVFCQENCRHFRLVLESIGFD